MQPVRVAMLLAGFPAVKRPSLPMWVPTIPTMETVSRGALTGGGPAAAQCMVLTRIYPARPGHGSKHEHISCIVHAAGSAFTASIVPPAKEYGLRHSERLIERKSCTISFLAHIKRPEQQRLRHKVRIGRKQKQNRA